MSIRAALSSFVDLRFEFGAVLVFLGADDGRGDAGLGRLGEAGGVRAAGQDQHDLGRIVRPGRGADERAHIGAAPGNEDGDALAVGHGFVRLRVPE